MQGGGWRLAGSGLQKSAGSMRVQPPDLKMRRSVRLAKSLSAAGGPPVLITSSHASTDASPVPAASVSTPLQLGEGEDVAPPPAESTHATVEPLRTPAAGAMISTLVAPGGEKKALCCRGRPPANAATGSGRTGRVTYITPSMYKVFLEVLLEESWIPGFPRLKQKSTGTPARAAAFWRRITDTYNERVSEAVKDESSGVYADLVRRSYAGRRGSKALREKNLQERLQANHHRSTDSLKKLLAQFARKYQSAVGKRGNMTGNVQKRRRVDSDVDDDDVQVSAAVDPSGPEYVWLDVYAALCAKHGTSPEEEEGSPDSPVVDSARARSLGPAAEAAVRAAKADDDEQGGGELGGELGREHGGEHGGGHGGGHGGEQGGEQGDGEQRAGEQGGEQGRVLDRQQGTALVRTSSSCSSDARVRGPLSPVPVGLIGSGSDASTISSKPRRPHKRKNVSADPDDPFMSMLQSMRATAQERFESQQEQQRQLAKEQLEINKQIATAITSHFTRDKDSANAAETDERWARMREDLRQELSQDTEAVRQDTEAMRQDVRELRPVMELVLSRLPPAPPPPPAPQGQT